MSNYDLKELISLLIGWFHIFLKSLLKFLEVYINPLIPLLTAIFGIKIISWQINDGNSGSCSEDNDKHNISKCHDLL